MYNRHIKDALLPKIILAIGLVLLFADLAGAAGVVVLHSGSGPNPWAQKIVSGINSEFGEGIVVKQEFLGSKAVGEVVDEEHFYDKFERIARSHAQDPPSAVIVNGKTAFAFMRKYHEDLFPKVPVVFCAMPMPAPGQLMQCGPCTGVPMEQDVDRTMGLIFTLRPDTGTLVGIMDGSPASRDLRKKAEAAMEPYSDRAQLVFPGHETGDSSGLDMKKLASVASSIPASGAVLFLGFREDRSGNPLDEGEAIGLLVKRSQAPIFVLTDTWLGSGVIGGFMATGEAQGCHAGKIVRRIMAGEPPEKIRYQALPAQLVTDATALARFSMRAETIASIPGAKTINEPLRPSDPQGISSTNVFAAVLSLIAFAGVACLLGVFTGRRRR